MAGFELRPARLDDAPQVEEFNRRMAAAGTKQALSVAPPFQKIGRHESSPIQLVRYLCFLDGRVRGGVSVKSMPFLVSGREVEVANLSYPVSEGVADRRYAGVGLAMLRELVERYPLLYALGVGGLDHPLARLLRTLRWHVLPVPFRFCVLRAGPFLRNLRFLRKRRGMESLLDALAATGLGSVGLAVARTGQRLRRLGRGFRRPEVRELADWESWIDDLWASAGERYDLVGARSSDTLRALYPPGHRHYRKIAIDSRDGKPIGWAVYTAARLENHAYFGNARLGAIIDSFAAPEDAQLVVDGTFQAMKTTEADLLVVNQIDHRWKTAYARAGFLSWRSNFFLFLSPQLKERLAPIEEHAGRFYFMRGDGDGPVNLW